MENDEIVEDGTVVLAFLLFIIMDIILLVT